MNAGWLGGWIPWLGPAWHVYTYIYGYLPGFPVEFWRVGSGGNSGLVRRSCWESNTVVRGLVICILEVDAELSRHPKKRTYSAAFLYHYHTKLLAFIRPRCCWRQPRSKLRSKTGRGLQGALFIHTQFVSKLSSSRTYEHEEFRWSAPKRETSSRSLAVPSRIPCAMACDTLDHTARAPSRDQERCGPNPTTHTAVPPARGE